MQGFWKRSPQQIGRTIGRWLGSGPVPGLNVGLGLGLSVVLSALCGAIAQAADGTVGLDREWGLNADQDLAQGVDPLDLPPGNQPPTPIGEIPARTSRLGQGVTLRQGMVNVGSDRFATYWLEIAPGAAARIRPIAVRPDSQTGTAPLVLTARATRANVAINAGFFNRDRQLPLSPVKVDGRWLSGPILNRGAVAWDDRGNWRFDRLALRETILVEGRSVQLTQFNSGYVEAGVARYSRTWGSSYQPLSDNESVATIVRENVITPQGGRVTRDRITTVQTLGTAGSAAVPIPNQGYLLVVRSQAQWSAWLRPNLSVLLTSQSLPLDFDRLPQVVGGGPLLLQGGRIVLDAARERFQPGFIRQAALRTAIARRADGTILLVTGHERLGVGGRGPSLDEWARLLQGLGAIDALNLDGGSSTSFFVGDRLIDRAPGTAARVHGGVGVFFDR